MRLLLWYSGEHPDLPKAEAAAAFAACAHTWDVRADGPRFQVAETDALGTQALDCLRRLGLTHDVSAHLFDAPTARFEVPPADQCLAPGARFAVRAERVGGGAAWRRTEAERRVGAVLAPGRHVDLRRPETIVRAFVDAEHVWVGRQLWDRDPKDTASRHVHRRPSFSPVSLPPKLARALINLARVPPGGLLADPMCGTGGILIEAASMGIRVAGSDLDSDMVEGTRRNLAHFGFRAQHLSACDVGDAPSNYVAARAVPADGVVMDLPYGRSASTGKERLDPLYDRAFEAAARIVRPGGCVVVGVPTERNARRAGDFLRLDSVHKVRVHRSLTRHFALLHRPG